MRASKVLNGIFEFFTYLVLAMLPILGIYNGYWIFDLGTLLLLAIMTVDLLVKKGKIELNTKLLVIIVILACINIIAGFLHMDIIDLENSMNNSIQMIIVAVICAYFVKSSIVRKDTFYKYIKVVALISSIFLFVQFFLYKNGLVITGFLSFVNEELLSAYPVIPIAYGRPNSFFLEPAHFALYVLPVYALSLQKRNFITSIILLTALYMSTSTTGVVIAIVITLIFILKEKKIPIIIKCVVFLIGLSVLLMNISAIADTQIFEKMKFSNLKDNIRVFGGLKYFKYFGLKDMIFGLGINQLATFIKSYTTSDVLNGTNAFFFSFYSFGIVGGLLLNKYLYDLHRLSRHKLLFIIFVCIYISDQFLFNRHFIYLTLLLFVFSDKGDVIQPTEELQ